MTHNTTASLWDGYQQREGDAFTRTHICVRTPARMPTAFLVSSQIQTTNQIIQPRRMPKPSYQSQIQIIQQAMLLQEEALIAEFGLGEAVFMGERTLVVAVQELIQVGVHHIPSLHLCV